MRIVLGLCFFLIWSLGVLAQTVTLPEDLRQHNLTRFNSNLLNPTFSFNRNNQSEISLWSRWQWQTIDGDPTTLLFNYTGNLNSESVFGIGFLQHNTGTFLNTGGLLNYVYAFDLDNGVKLFLGANAWAFQRKLADDRFVPDDDLDLPQLQETNDFLMQFTPAVRLLANNFSLALALENAFDINFSEDGGESAGSIFIGVLSNDFPISLFDDNNSHIRPVVYVKTIPNADTQVGVNALLSTPWFWAQTGYNSFYGPSAGVGVTFANTLSVGGLLEFATGSDLADETSTFELLLSYHFGQVDHRKKVVGFEVDEEEEEKIQNDRVRLEKEAEEERQRKIIAAQEAQREQRKTDSIKQAADAQRRTKFQDSIAAVRLRQEQQRIQDSIATAKSIFERQRIQDSIARAQAKQQRIQDSLVNAKRKELALLQEKKRSDSLAAVQAQEVDVRPGEKYEEVTRADGLAPGFYLIANVFGTKKYFENFMQTLRARGLEPKSFYRSLNGYNYVYLERYTTIEEARKARDSKFDGKYTDKTWIFRVRGD